MDKIRIIKTKFYGDRAYDILRAVAGNLSDGKWENARGYDKYWTNFNVKQLPDNQVVFEVNAGPYEKWGRDYLRNPFLNMDDAKFLAWYAGKLKAVIKDEAKYEEWNKGWWNRDNMEDRTTYLSYDLDVTVADVYTVYDELLGRKNRADDVYGTRVWGHKADDETIAKRNELEAKKKALYDAYLAKKAELNEKLKKLTGDIELAKTKAFDEYRAAAAALDAE